MVTIRQDPKAIFTHEITITLSKYLINQMLKKRKPMDITLFSDPPKPHIREGVSGNTQETLPLDVSRSFMFTSL